MARKRRYTGNHSRKLRAFWAPVIAAGDVVCPRCLKPITLEQRWHVGHAIDDALGGEPTVENTRPEHGACNESAGGKLGRQMQRAASRQARRLPSWV